MGGHGGEHHVREVEQQHDHHKGAARAVEAVHEPVLGTAAVVVVGAMSIAAEPEARLHAPARQEQHSAAHGIHGMQQRRAEERRVDSHVE